MAESLYTTETPDSGLGDLSDLGSGHTAGSFTFAADGSVSGIRFWAPATVAGGTTITGELWQVTQGEGTSSGSGTGTLLGSKAVSGATITPAGWNVITLDTPISVTTGTVYRSAVHNSAGRYVAIIGYFATAHTTGNVTGIQSGAVLAGGQVVRNGTYRAGSTAGQYPSSYFGSPTYLVDVVYTAAGATPQAAAALTATSTLTGAVRTVATAAAPLATATTLTAAAVRVARTAATLAGSGRLTITATADQAIPGVLTASGTAGTLTAAGTGGTLTAAGSP